MVRTAQRGEFKTPAECGRGGIGCLVKLSLLLSEMKNYSKTIQFFVSKTSNKSTISVQLSRKATK